MTPRRRGLTPLSALVAAAAALGAAQAHAGEPAVPLALLGLEGDPEYGAYLAADCLSCHRADGRDVGIPAITGWTEAKFRAALHAYQTGARDNAVMQGVARTLGDAEIAALSAWFAQAR